MKEHSIYLLAASKDDIPEKQKKYYRNELWIHMLSKHFLQIKQKQQRTIARKQFKRGSAYFFKNLIGTNMTFNTII